MEVNGLGIEEEKNNGSDCSSGLRHRRLRSGRGNRYANHESINRKAGDEINIKYVLDLRDFPGDPVQEILVHDFETIINDPEVDIIVEVMGGLEPAYTFTRRALEAGKSVCTSNKELVAEHGVELLELARKNNINYLFEASAAAEFRSSVR